MHKIIALWSHPRSMSTATERIMRERGDLNCFHEPFMYDYYVNRRAVNRKAGDMPHFTIDPSHPVAYEDIRDRILTQAQTGACFIKDMSYYVVDRITTDPLIAPHLINCFLIRNPLAAITSYVKLDQTISLEEVGLEAQWRHYSQLCTATSSKNAVNQSNSTRSNATQSNATQSNSTQSNLTTNAKTHTPVVLDADDIRANPRKVICQWWSHIGLEPCDHAFEWTDDIPEDWKQVGNWHRQASASSHIKPPDDDERKQQQKDFASLALTQPQIKTYLQHHQPYYEKLRANRLRCD